MEIVVGVLASLIAWYITKEYEKRKKPKLHYDITKFAGKWYGLHYTKNDSTKKNIESQHEYNLKVDKRGFVTGSMLDTALSPPVSFSVEGMFTSSGLVLISQGDWRPGFYATEFYPPINTENDNIGILSGYDYNNNPFSTIIIFSKIKPSSKQLKDTLADSNGMFYT